MRDGLIIIFAHIFLDDSRQVCDCGFYNRKRFVYILCIKRVTHIVDCKPQIVIWDGHKLFEQHIKKALAHLAVGEIKDKFSGVFLKSFYREVSALINHGKHILRVGVIVLELVFLRLSSVDKVRQKQRLVLQSFHKERRSTALKPI